MKTLLNIGERPSPFRLLACSMVVALGLGSGMCAHADDLDDAFARLVAGRAYLKDYPNAKSRDRLVDDFIGANGQLPNRPDLEQAIDRAVVIRNSERPEPESFPTGQVPRSVQAKVIAWEALESLLTGYSFAGNRDLLNATRVAYPGSSLANDPRQLPAEETSPFNGTSQKQISYARLYFLQGIKDVLSYVAEDTTGTLRAGSPTFPTLPHYVVFDDEQSEILPFPRFDDTDFGGAGLDREASQSVAYLYGSALDRLGLAAVSYADQLWRSAYAGPGAGAKRPESEKNAMLQRAADVLKENVHAEFLASLPLAAQLSDSADGTANEFQQSKIDQARVSVTSALRLREQILAGEKPTQTALVSAWDSTSLEQQISRCRDAEEAARLKWGGDASPPVDGSVAFELNRTEQAQTLTAEREITLRNSLETQLFEITGIDPGFYGGLRIEEDRTAYLADVRAKFENLLNNQNPNAPGLLDGSQMSVQALRLIQAMREAVVARARIDAFAQKMRTELERNNDVNATVLINGAIYSAIELALGAAFATPDVSVCTCGMASGVTAHQSPGAIPASIQAALKVFRTATETATINSTNSAALIKNLLIDQQVAIEELSVTELNASIAGAELRQLLARASRLVQDHIFFQGITDTLWYRDPSLAFKLEQAEEEYQDLLQEYRIELYKLGRMLEAGWTERFQNPVKQANGSTVQPLNNGSFDEFTEAESAFSVVNHVRGRAFFNALKAWDLKLREPLFRGPHSSLLWDANSFSGQPISLRRDIFKLIDYRYDFAGNRYEVDAGLTRQTIQQFRALLLDVATRDPANAGGLSRLRIDFPLTYNQARVILGQQSPVPIVQQNRPGGTFDQFWNHRVKEIGVKIVGKNVFAAGSTIPVSFELFGSVDRIGFFPDSLFTFTRAISSFQVPLYQRDPDRRLIGEPFFGTGIGIPAAIGSTPVPMNQVNGWPLFCDRIVLRFGSQGSLRIENIEDIELYVRMEVGSPPPIPNNIW
jgi:hypothetical protein